MLKVKRGHLVLLLMLNVSTFFAQNISDKLWIKGFLTKNNYKTKCTNHNVLFYANSMFYCVNTLKSKIPDKIINEHLEQYVNIMLSFVNSDSTEIVIHDIKSVLLPKEIHIIDGNANKYEISKKSIEYIPVEPIMSSSGYYSGGEYRKLEISSVNFIDIYQRIEKLAENKNNLLTNRIKGSTLVVLYFSNNDEKSYIFKENKAMNHLYEMLNNLIKK